MTASPLQISSLGRPFQLGMLYDCHKDHLVSEVTLWNTETLKKYRSSTPGTKLTFNHDILDKDTLDEKYKYLDITGDLKLSCLIGFVKFSGSARFLNDVSSLQQVRMCFKHCIHSKYEELNIYGLKDIPCVHGISATHVTGISYGTDVIFVFDYTLQQNEDRQEITEFLKTTVENLPYLYVDDNGDIKYNLEVLNTDKINKICCRLHTDIR